MCGETNCALPVRAPQPRCDEVPKKRVNLLLDRVNRQTNVSH